MTKADLKPGYVVKNRDETYYVVLPVGGGRLAFTRSGGWDPLDNYQEDLTSGVCTELDVMEVYGFAECTTRALNPDPVCSERPLLWKRREVKKMTVKEICEALGYDVEIVKEGGEND